MKALPLITLAFVVLLILGVAAAKGDPGITTTPEGDLAPPSASSTAPLVVYDFELAVLRKQLHDVQHRNVALHKRVRQLQHVVHHTPTVREAISLACSVYGGCSTLWRRADCESGFFARAKNPSGASGLYQFLPSTWASTPFGAFSIWSPYANALAAGWMQANGRGGEWVCR